MIKYITNQTNLEVYQDPEIVLSTVEESLDELWDMKIIGADTETEGFDPHTQGLLLLQLGNYEVQYVIDCTTVDITAYKELLESRDKIIIFHNANFDLRFLYKRGIIPYRNIYDTFLSEAILRLGINSHRKSLAACVKRYCKKTLPKEIRGAIHRLGPYNTSVIKYAANDVKYLETIREHQLNQAEDLNLVSCINFENVFVSVLAYVQYCGIKLNTEKWKIKAEQDSQEKYELEKKLNEELEELNFPEFLRSPDLFNDKPSAHINWNSSSQVIKLFLKLGLDLTTIDKETKEEKLSVESKVIEPQKDKHPIVDLYLQYKEKSKLESTYGHDFLKHVNGATRRIHTHFTQNVATGRLSSGRSDPKRAKPGEVNMQNIPRMPDKKYRKPGKIYERECFIAEEGNKFAVADYSGQETMVLAYLSQDPAYYEFATNKDKDIHSLLASFIFDELRDVPLMEIKKNHPEKRQFAKGATFAIAYGGNGYTIASNLGLSIEKGEQVYNSYLEYFSTLKKYWEQVQQDTMDRGYILISKMSGRKSFFPHTEQYLAIKERLESMALSSPNEGKFQGLTNSFWKYYSYHKKNETTEFIELKQLVRKYFSYRSNMGKKALNYPVQGLSAEMSKLAGIKLFDYIIQNNLFGVLKICVPLHDEWAIEGPEEHIEEYAEVLQKCMEDAAQRFCPDVGIKASPVITNVWEH
jgi:DNA polymerase I-like protein with 3'-5' exonuclease and polymerase domains